MKVGKAYSTLPLLRCVYMYTKVKWKRRTFRPIHRPDWHRNFNYNDDFGSSYGAVYRAERRADGAEVAVKIIPADNPTDLLKEVDFMMACSSPYIVRLHDSHYKVRLNSSEML